uniref:Uncharacterized protein n=1 Tax=Heterosigma akashiwo TaxID=2829 RepID=A0A6V1PRG6_HETAK|mmetsp:Transcript_37939/g.66332  ORF Transcript_37939/g.66332 Transcript_37939/m.66332 type:complete len:291 (+) Transcript_37939:131-1003(+)
MKACYNLLVAALLLVNPATCFVRQTSSSLSPQITEECGAISKRQAAKRSRRRVWIGVNAQEGSNSDDETSTIMMNGYMARRQNTKLDFGGRSLPPENAVGDFENMEDVSDTVVLMMRNREEKIAQLLSICEDDEECDIQLLEDAIEQASKEQSNQTSKPITKYIYVGEMPENGYAMRRLTTKLDFAGRSLPPENAVGDFENMEDVSDTVLMMMRNRQKKVAQLLNECSETEGCEIIFATGDQNSSLETEEINYQDVNEVGHVVKVCIEENEWLVPASQAERMIAAGYVYC